LDIAWLWHCHRLAPLRYEAFCQRRFHVLLEPSPAFVFQTDQKPDVPTALAWNSLFPHEPVFAGHHLQNNDGSSTRNDIIPSSKDLDELLDGYNIMASATAQATFLWQVSGPMYQDDSFLEKAVENYHKFLQVVLTEGELPLVPTYQIDLMWHTHMLSSITKYNQDCLTIRGCKFSHDDSLNDRSTGAKLELSFHATCRRWEDMYGTSYAVPGGMYRGEPETAYYDYVTWSPTTTITRRSCTTETVPLPHSMAPTTTMMMGASSTGSDSPWVVPTEQDKSFIPGNAKYVGASANPQMENYVFGKGSNGDGYYSFATKDAYQIFKLRLTHKYTDEYITYHEYGCRNCLCLGGSPTVEQMREKEALKTRMDQTAELLAIIKTRLTMPGPDAKITLAAAQHHGAKCHDPSMTSSSSSGTTAAAAGGGTITYYDANPAVLWSAAGCGGGFAASRGGNPFDQSYMGGGGWVGGGCGGG
jgi:hypothetical protein